MLPESERGERALKGRDSGRQDGAERESQAVICISGSELCMCSNLLYAGIRQSTPELDE